ncbi:MAG: N-acetyltransferase [Gammaproteobacteria bacterium]|nr:MAG: N-acetyltransferase [Gammaproteobacteria bacterium]
MTRTDILIQRASENDFDGILKIAKSLPEWFTNQGIREIEQDFQKCEKLVASEFGKIIGFLLYSNLGENPLINWIAVEKKFHRRGIGTLLLDSLERELVAQGYSNIIVKTLGGDSYEPYVKTRLFYLNTGFREESQVLTNLDEWPIELTLFKEI